MNGIQSLMGQLMPGQAPMQPLPGVMPQPGAPTPGAMTSSLKNMSLDQLKALYQNPNPNSPPLWAVISALAEKQKEAQAMMAAQGQAAMAQNQQMQQQPPVAAQVVEAAEQMEEPVMAMHGGEMHGYAGGGAVAFQNGGRTFGYAPDYELARKYGINLSPYDSPEVRAEKIKRARAMEGFEEQAKSFGEIPTEASVARDALLQRAFADPSRSRDVLSAKMPEVTRPNLPVDSGISTGRAPQQSATMFDITSPASINALRLAAQDTSLPEAERADLRKRIAMMEQQAPSRTRGIGAPVEQTGTPAIDAYTAAVAAQQEAMRRAGEVTPEMLAARGGIDKLLGASVSGFEEERKRREAAAQQRMQEAQARFERRGLEDMAGIGRLLSGMRGAKTFYEGLTGAGAAAGKYQEDKEAALRVAQEKFDLSNREVFELSRLQDQVRMKQAELAEARASGDAQRSVKAAMDVAAAQKDLAKYQTDLGITREKLELEARRIAATEADAAAKLGRPTEIDFFRQDPEGYARFMAARQGPRNEPKAMTYDQAADNVSKFLDTQAGMMEIFAIRKQAKEAGQPEPSFSQIRDMLIQRELQGAGAKTAPALGNQAAPPVGTVMQGYRFKGGNPADRNNWEKV